MTTQVTAGPVYSLHPQLAQDTLPVLDLTLCSVRLSNDAGYPWLVLVPRVPEARELIDLDDAGQLALVREIAQASRVLRHCFAPHKLNVAALGNMVPQLHVHVIARYTHDAAWPAPVWGRAPAQAYAPGAQQARAAQLRDAFTRT